MKFKIDIFGNNSDVKTILGEVARGANNFTYKKKANVYGSLIVEIEGEIKTDEEELRFLYNCLKEAIECYNMDIKITAVEGETEKVNVWTFGTHINDVLEIAYSEEQADKDKLINDTLEKYWDKKINEYAEADKKYIENLPF